MNKVTISLAILLCSIAPALSQKLGAGIHSEGDYQRQILSQSNTLTLQVTQHVEDECWTNQDAVAEAVKTKFAEQSIKTAQSGVVKLHMTIMANGLMNEGARVGCIGFINFHLYYEGFAYPPSGPKTNTLHRVNVSLFQRTYRSASATNLNMEFAKWATEYSGEIAKIWNGD